MFKKNKKENGLSIIVVGCGKVGMALVEQLSKEGHDITIIDTNREKVQIIANQYDVMGLAGNGASYSVQIEAGIEKSDLIIAVTGSDELNLLCCTIAKHVGNCSTIARVRTPDYSIEARYLREKLGLSMIINPELESALEATKILCLPHALHVNSFAHGQVEMIQLKIEDKNYLDGMTIADFGKSREFAILICAIERDEEVFIPSGDFIMKKGDIVYFVAPRKSSKAFMNKIGLKTSRVKNTMIIGGGRASYYLAKNLINMGIDVKIIESSRERCEELSVLLPKCVVINGDGTDEELLLEEGIQEAESFVPLTGIDEENVMLTMYAKQVSNAKVITKIRRGNFKNVINRLDLGSVIYPRYITAEAIIAYVRAKNASKSSNIETLYKLFDSRAEAIEFQVDEESKVTNIPLSELSLKKDLLIAFINRNEEILIPNGQDCIKAGDSVIIVTKHTGFTNILDILEG